MHEAVAYLKKAVLGLYGKYLEQKLLDKYCLELTLLLGYFGIIPATQF